MQLNARRGVYEFGLLPLHAICPALDNAATLYSLHARLMEKSTKSPTGQNLVTAAEVGTVLGLSSTQLEIMLEVLAALSIKESGAAGEGGAVSSSSSGPSPMDVSPGLPVRAQGASSSATDEPVLLHELSMFLLMQLYIKEAVRVDNQEVWPEALRPAEASNQFEFARPGTPENMSPTRQTLTRTLSLGSKALLRQQLQQHVRQHALTIRGFGDFVRRNLRTVFDLCLDVPPPGATATPPKAPGADSPTASVRISQHEVDRADFLIQPMKGSITAGSPLGSCLPQLAAGGTMPVDGVVSLFRQSWCEYPVEPGSVAASLESPRHASGSNNQFSPVLSSPRSFNSSTGTGSGGSTSFTLSRSSSARSSTANPAPVPAYVDDASVSGIIKGTVVRGELTGSSIGDLRIVDCHDAVVYLLGPIQHVFVVGCSECVIVLGAVGSVVRLERCDKLQVIAATRRMVISSCHDCTLYLGVNRPPLMIGDNRFLRLAPFNARYERQTAHVREAGLRLDVPNMWDTPVILTAGKERKSLSSSPTSPRSSFSLSTTSLSTKLPYSLLPPDDFLPFVIPFLGAGGALAGGAAPPQSTRWSQLAALGRGVPLVGPSHSPHPPQRPGSSSAASPSPTQSAPLYLFPLPPDYERALNCKLSMTGELRQRFKQAGLGREKERELNDAIQGHFREWLSSSNMLRQIYDLSNLEKEEQQAAAAVAAAAAAAAGGGAPGSSGGGAGGSGAMGHV